MTTTAPTQGTRIFIRTARLLFACITVSHTPGVRVVSRFVLWHTCFSTFSVSHWFRIRFGIKTWTLYIAPLLSLVMVHVSCLIVFNSRICIIDMLLFSPCRILHVRLIPLARSHTLPFDTFHTLISIDHDCIPTRTQLLRSHLSICPLISHHRHDRSTVPFLLFICVSFHIPHTPPVCCT